MGHSDDVNKYIEKVSNEDQYPLRFELLYGHSTIQGVESIKNYFLNVRNDPMAAAWIMAVEGDQKWHLDASREFHRLSNSDLPRRVKYSLENWSINLVSFNTFLPHF